MSLLNLNIYNSIILIVGLISSALEGCDSVLFTGLFGSISEKLKDYQKLEGKEFESEMKGMSLNFLYLSLFLIVLFFVRSYCFSKTTSVFAMNLKNKFFASITKQSINWQHEQSQTDLNQQILKIKTIDQQMATEIPSTIKSTINCILSLSIAFYNGWKLSLIMFSLFPVVVAVFVVCFHCIDNENHKSLNIIEETITNMKTIIIYKGQFSIMKRLKKQMSYEKKKDRKNFIILGILAGFLIFFIYVCFVFGVWFSANLMKTHVYTLKNVLIVFFSIIFGASSLRNMSTGTMEILKNKREIENIIEVIDNTSEEINEKEADINGDIVFNNVFFGYNQNKVLNNISLTIPFGKTVAFVGPSGSGKSTIINLIQRHYRVQDGTIEINQQNINSMKLAKHISIINQEPILFRTSIYQNIAFGANSCSIDQVVAAAKSVNAHDFIMNLPQGYETIIGDTQLSGGQKQRICIARAMITNAPILLLDEATSALDSQNEKLVQSALNQVSNRTTIMVAHRLSTVKNADIIYVLNNGSIVESGSHQELLALNGLYYDLINTQQSPKPAPKPTAQEKTVKSNKEQISIIIKEASFNRSNERELLDYVFTQKLNLFLGCLAIIIDSLTLPMLAALIGKLIELKSETQSVILFWCLITLLVGLVGFCGQFGRFGILRIAINNIATQIRLDIVANLMKQEAQFFDQSNSLLQVLDEKVELISEYYISYLTLILSLGLTFFVNFIFSFVVCWPLALALLAFLPLFSLSYFLDSLFLKSLIAQKASLVSENELFSIDAVNKMKTVIELKQEAEFQVQFEVRNTKINKINNVLIIFNSLFNAWSQNLIYFFYSLAFYLGSKLIVHFGYSVSSIMMVIFAIIIFGVDIARNSFQFQVIKKAKASMSIIELKNRQSSIKDNGQSNMELDGSINIENVSFGYTDKLILDNFTAKLSISKNIALVGPSGGGKSSLLYLVSRLYENNQGSIKINETPINQISLDNLRSKISIVEQETKLFNLSIEENIRFSYPEASKEDIINAAKLADIHDFILSLPYGYETIVKDNLSGGQKQRISIARAVLKPSSIILLDEATSALDSKSEQFILNNLFSLDRTIISVNHRLNVVQYFDQILVVDNSKVVEAGTHDQLMLNKGLYSELCN